MSDVGEIQEEIKTLFDYNDQCQQEWLAELPKSVADQKKIKKKQEVQASDIRKRPPQFLNKKKTDKQDEG